MTNNDRQEKPRIGGNAAGTGGARSRGDASGGTWAETAGSRSATAAGVAGTIIGLRSRVAYPHATFIWASQASQSLMSAALDYLSTGSGGDPRELVHRVDTQGAHDTKETT